MVAAERESIVKYLTIFLFGFILSFCTPEATQLQRIQQLGEMKVAILPYTHLSPAQKKLDMALIQSFAEQLKVKPRFVTVANMDEMMQLVSQQKVDFTIVYNPLHQHPQLRTAPFYQDIEHYLVYHRKSPLTSKNINQLVAQNQIYTSQHVLYEQILQQFKLQHPKLHWQTFESSSTDLLAALNTQHVILTNSHQLAEIRHFYPHLSIAASVSQQQLGWGFLREAKDDSLYQAAVTFIEQAKQSGELERLRQYYHGELTIADDFNAFNINSFYKNMNRRLPLYRHSFEQVSLRQRMDWRLIASVGYEESLWNPKAVSRTGVRGLMMLTEDTADYLGVENREDPFQSIEGGARYLRKLHSRLPAEVTEPDRTWFMLAAYNVGFGHVMDARKLAEQAGHNPNYWGVIKKYLLLLSEPKWYKQTKHGKARGYEAVEYVRRIRRYYVMLKFVDQKTIPEQLIQLSNGYKTPPYQSPALVWY
ncbi:membrane-bound lytic murein transglycosylase MltF [Candidatus Albibeggiatoa sp. nov. NOAA]|uniref:membrane-bound lytic murein transglycosylase MltF n=1 Tax=Candidatus Albibeggiatoa sp. nov. NOAA TaxID=3162724 RepID=UPI0032F61CA8|nr:membrane-bound lytic murein transglycosylase MltF [Thiotrichaceae bacterium]